MCDVFDEIGVDLSRHFSIYIIYNLYRYNKENTPKREERKKNRQKERKKRKDKLCLYSIVLSSVCKHKNQNIQKKFIF